MFGQEEVARDIFRGVQFRLCTDNLEECIVKTEKLLTHAPFLALVKGISGKSESECAAVFTQDATTKQRTSMARAI